MIKIKHLFLLVLLCFTGSSVFAQKGARISGTITSDAEGPLIMVNITERDPSNRIIEACVTDFEGNFSMVVKNTSNVLEISYVGYKTQRVEIGNRTVFNIKMVEDNMLETVDIVAESRSRSGGLDILDREMTHATQKISMDDMDGLSFASVDEALQGKIAGLDVVFNSGDVGAGTQMRLRGNSTLGGDATPLIVVDDNIFEVDEGTNIREDATADSFAELLMINTEDIAEIEVLKDAASCAVWGSRGANGVIKIKTRRGKRGPARVSFSYKFKDKWTPSGYNLLNGDDYTMLIKQALFNVKHNAADVNVSEFNYDKNFPEYENYNNNTDWVDAISKHGYRNEYNLNISGGGEKATFRISGAYSNENGQVRGQNLNSFTARLALDYYVSARIKVIADFAFSYTKQRRNAEDLLYNSLLMMPNMSIYSQDSLGNNTDAYYSILKYGSSSLLWNAMSNSGRTKNPLAVGELAQYHTENFSINPMITFEYNLLGLEDNESQLKYRGMVNLNASTYTGTKYMPAALYTSEWHDPSKNSSSADDSKSLGFTTRHQLIFTPYLGSKDHYMTMNGQFELSTGSGNSQYSTANHLPTGNISSSTVGAMLASSGTGKWQTRNVSFVFDAHYSYKSKYSLRLAVRGEGNTAMGDDRKWAAFPSLSARWNIIDESWMEWAKPYLSMFSLRPGFGIGGHAPGSNATFNSYTSTGLTYLGMAGFKMENIRLTDLRRSNLREWNIGSDFGFFNDFFTGAFNFYHNTTRDNIINGYKLPSSTGFDRLEYKNSGSVRNYGWELNMNLNNIKLAKDFSMSMYFNIGNNFNEILELEEAYLEERNPDYTLSNSTYLSRIQIGNPSGAIYGFRYKGVYRYSYKNWEKALKEEEAGRDGSCPIVRDADGNVVYMANGEPKRLVLFYDNEDGSDRYKFNGGDAIYEDVNHDGTINQLDIVYLGNSNPAAQGGFGLTFRYKKWSLRTSFTYRLNVDVVNSSRMSFENMASFDNQSVAVNWRWRKDGDMTEIPRAVNGSTNAYNYLGSDRYVEDASYVRLSYVQLSYSFKPEWLKKIGVKNLNLYASADNVAFWTKYTGLDPEVANGGEGIAYDGSKTPRPRSYTISLSLGF